MNNITDNEFRFYFASKQHATKGHLNHKSMKSNYFFRAISFARVLIQLFFQSLAELKVKQKKNIAHLLKVSRYVENKFDNFETDFPLPSFICIITILNNMCRKLPYKAKG